MPSLRHDRVSGRNPPDFPDSTPTGGTTLEKRLLSHQITRYHADTLNTPAALGGVGERAIPYDQHLLALTSGLATGVFGARVNAATIRSLGGYVDVDSDASGTADGDFWIGSGTLVLATGHFFEPVTHRDPFGNESSLTWDDDALVLSEMTDPVGNTTTVDQIDYQTLSGVEATDPNGTVTALRLDPLGRVVAAIVHDGTDGDLSLDHPTTRFTYVDDAWQTEGQPNHILIEARIHHGGTWPTLATDLQIRYEYLDGGGRVIQVKVPAAAGPAPKRDAGTGELVHDGSGALVWENVDPRCLAGERRDLVKWGVSPIYAYDPIGRNTEVRLRDGAVRRFGCSPWRVEAQDEADTETGGAHENTQNVAHLDNQGRTFRGDEYLLPQDSVTERDGISPFDPETSPDVLRTRLTLDVQGNPTTVTDPRDNPIQVQTFDLLGRPLFTGAADEGNGTTSGAGETGACSSR